MSEQMELNTFLAVVRDGEEHGWPTEFEWLRQRDGESIRQIIGSVLRLGIQRPVLIGSDGRLWDGHHRVYAAWALGFTHIPVEYARDTGYRDGIYGYEKRDPGDYAATPVQQNSPEEGQQ
jgi:hypothetical protein